MSDHAPLLIEKQRCPLRWGLYGFDRRSTRTIRQAHSLSQRGQESRERNFRSAIETQAPDFGCSSPSLKTKIHPEKNKAKTTTKQFDDDDERSFFLQYISNLHYCGV